MSGLLAGQYFKNKKPIIIEQSPELPNNHKALLRFRSGVVSELTGIPFKKVTVDKMISYRGCHYTVPNIFFSNMYSLKTTGVVSRRSAVNLFTCERFIAPEDFISKAAEGLDIQYGVDGQSAIKDRMTPGKDKDYPIISTIPVSTLAEYLGYELKWEPQYKPIKTLVFTVPDCDAYQTIYYPDIDIPIYRISVTGNKVIVEMCSSTYGSDDIFNLGRDLGGIIDMLKEDFSIYGKAIGEPTLTESKYGKLIPCNDNEVKRFISWATRKYNIFSVGRWGTHRQILMDDVVHDLNVIDHLIKIRY